MARKPKPKWQPSPDDFLDVVREQNPWFELRRVPTSLAPPTEREVVRPLVAALQRDTPRRFRLMLGPRRVGKTTVMYQVAQHLMNGGLDPSRVCWFRLDHPLFIEVGLDRLVRSMIRQPEVSPDRPLYVFLDEVTYAENWDLWLKTAYDEQWPVRITATSSAVAALRDKRMESGVGRWEEHHLPPYLFHEYLRLVGRLPEIDLGETLADTLHALSQRPQPIDLHGDLRRFLFTGGFPELLLRAGAPTIDEQTALLESQRTLKADAVDRVVWKDIAQAFRVDNQMAMERLLYTLGGQIGGIMSAESICESLRGITVPTFDRYVKYLEIAYLIFTTQNYSGTEEGRQRRGRKVYFVDVAVRNAALQRQLAPLSSPAELGLMYENAAASHLHALSQQGAGRLYHWRDGKHEVDLIFEHPGAEPIAIEIGSSTSHTRAGFAALVAKHPQFRGRCYLAVPQLALARPPVETSGQVGEIALESLLLAAGLHVGRAWISRIGGG